jgi:hypothetical protein
MRMRAHIDRHVIDRDREIRAVIEIVAAQKILVGFALAAVLRHDEAGRGLQDLAGAGERTSVEFRTGDPHLARHVRRTHRTRSHVRGARSRRCNRCSGIHGGSNGGAAPGPGLGNARGVGAGFGRSAYHDGRQRRCICRKRAGRRCRRWRLRQRRFEKRRREGQGQRQGGHVLQHAATPANRAGRGKTQDSQSATASPKLRFEQAPNVLLSAGQG